MYNLNIHCLLLAVHPKSKARIKICWWAIKQVHVGNSQFRLRWHKCCYQCTLMHFIRPINHLFLFFDEKCFYIYIYCLVNFSESSKISVCFFHFVLFWNKPTKQFELWFHWVILSNMNKVSYVSESSQIKWEEGCQNLNC